MNRDDAKRKLTSALLDALPDASGRAISAVAEALEAMIDAGGTRQPETKTPASEAPKAPEAASDEKSFEFDYDSLPPGFTPWYGATPELPKPEGYDRDRQVVTYWRKQNWNVFGHNGDQPRGGANTPVAFATINWKHNGRKDDVVGYAVLPIPEQEIIKSRG